MDDNCETVRSLAFDDPLAVSGPVFVRYARLGAEALPRWKTTCFRPGMGPKPERLRNPCSLATKSKTSCRLAVMSTDSRTSTRMGRAGYHGRLRSASKSLAQTPTCPETTCTLGSSSFTR